MTDQLRVKAVLSGFIAIADSASWVLSSQQPEDDIDIELVESECETIEALCEDIRDKLSGCDSKREGGEE